MRALALLIGLLWSSKVSAQDVPETATGTRSGFGAGAEATTTGIVGATFVYDAGPLHADFLLGVQATEGDDSIAAAARLFFPVHRGLSADFSVGPGLGIVDAGPGVQFHLEGAIQIRAFVVSNVALSASAGAGAVLGEGAESFQLGGQVGGAFGLTYFFW